MTPEKRTHIERGIAAYAHQREVMLRLLRKRGSFTEQDFDQWLRGREWRRPRIASHGIEGDSFLLGLGLNGGAPWAEWLELLQYMIILGEVEAKRSSEDLIVYSLRKLEL